MASVYDRKNGLVLGAIAGGVALAGAGVLLWRWIRRELDEQAPAAAFSGTGAHRDSFVHIRDAGPEHIRDEDGDDWDALDQASDESFPTSDPPTANDFRSPEPIDYSADEPGSRPH